MTGARSAAEPIKVVETNLIRSGDEVSVEGGSCGIQGRTLGPIEIEIRYFDRSGLQELAESSTESGFLDLPESWPQSLWKLENHQAKHKYT